jgi:6-carboxyhexanoate--CoA ligase
VKKLEEAGIRKDLAKKAIELLEKGANPKGGNMRGAVLMDIKTGERLEPDQERGIRTVRVDWKDRRRNKASPFEKGNKKTVFTQTFGRFSPCHKERVLWNSCRALLER